MASGEAEIGPLSDLTSLDTLLLSDNQISEIGPLSTLTSLISLDLNQNQINDISPLVDNLGIDLGDWVRIMNNALECDEEDLDDITTLEERDVNLEHDC